MNSRATENNKTTSQRRCIYCGMPAQIIWVHGHGQCAACGINVEECCRGEQCGVDLRWTDLRSEL